MKETVRSSFFVFIFIFVSSIAGAQLAVHGRADLSKFNFEKEGSIDLSGTWEFYYNALLSPEDFKAPQTPQWIQVPGSWHRQGDYPALGFATYRIRLILPEKQFGLSLHFRIINSSAKIWINDEFVQETGAVGTDPTHYAPKLIATIVALPEKISNLDIVIQVANFSYYSGGIAGAPLLDKTSATFSRINKSNGIENFFAGSLIAMCLYQLILYFLFDRGKPYLWLSLICLGVALRTMIVHGGSFLLPVLYPTVEWEYWKKIEFGSIYAIVAFFPLYVYDLFPTYAPKKPIVAFVGLATIMCLTVLITPQYIYGSLLEICHAALLLTFIYAVYSIGKAWKAGNQDARIILFGVLASFPFILTEILKNSVIYPLNIELTYLVELGVLVFLLFQVYLLANHYAKSYKNLEMLNLNLEKIVTERTSQLTTANTVKDRLLSVMSHDIKSPLNSLRGLLQVYNKGAISMDEFGHFARHIENDLSKTNLLVENILFWTASQLKGLQVKKEKFDFHILIEENVQLFQTISASKKIVFHHNAPMNFMITSDRNILNFVIRNLIANAIKFSFEGGEINIPVLMENRTLSVQVKDQGIGMDEQTLQKLLTPDRTISVAGTDNEKGTGLGLALCREYLLKIGGQLTVESIAGRGSTFSFTLPVG